MIPLTVLHVSPHPDDELIGAPAALMALRDAGWRVVNLACSLGPADQAERRRRELAEACRRAGFDLEIAPSPLADPFAPLDLAAAEAVVSAMAAEALERLAPQIVVAPSPHDRHPGHEVVARGVLGAMDQLEGFGVHVPRLWLWGLWADLPFPTLAVGFDLARVDEILSALEAHAGEMARNDYRRLVRGRAEMNASLGPERVFGFGKAATGSDFVELLSELHLVGRSWRLGRPRVLDPGAPLAGGPVLDVTSWVHGPSITTTFGPPPAASS